MSEEIEKKIKEIKERNRDKLVPVVIVQKSTGIKVHEKLVHYDIATEYMNNYIGKHTKELKGYVIFH